MINKKLIINHLGTKNSNGKVVRDPLDIDTVSEHLACEFLKENYVYCTREDVSPEMWIYDGGIYIPKGKTYIEEFCRKHLESYYATSISQRVVNKIKADTFIDPGEFFDSINAEEIPVLNGILNKSKRTLRMYSPHDIFFNKLPVKYEPQAKCPKIDSHFSEVLRNSEDKKVLYEIGGYCLDRTHFIEKAFMFLGDGRNGKGKTLELFKRFVGAESCCSVPLSAMKEDSFNLNQMFGKLLNLSGDLNDTDLKNTGLFKGLTGRDLITAHRKFKTDLIFTSYCKNVFACNELPKVYDLSKGFWSRWILLEFPYEFIPEKEFSKLSEKEKEFKKIIDVDHIKKICSAEELSGLLNASLDGLDRLIKDKDFSYTIGTSEIKEMWIRKSNSFTAFCFDCIVESERDHMSKEDLRKYYNKYRAKFKLKGAGDKEIKATLEDLYGVGESRKMEEESYINTWTGIKYYDYQGFLKVDFQNKVQSEEWSIKNSSNPSIPISLPNIDKIDEDYEK